ncbi:MAG TPA: NADH-ubiquinone oxidoreductase subunit NDUFA12 family protein, partial [Alphaproteobacteria bacterium]|nr:NADH-ubiquinone oxidoreductase subunit NDUFA12 family protein [Alphaproteobacteria bacterium]
MLSLLDIAWPTFITISHLLLIPEVPMDNFSLIRRLSQLGTLVQTALCGVEVGRDEFGNRYYHERKTEQGVRQRRWVIYAGEPEA